MTVPFRSVPLLTCVCMGLSYSAPLMSVRADPCLVADTCFSVKQTATEPCLKEQNNSFIDTLNLTENSVILSVHGSSIEQVNGHMSPMLAMVDGWNRYDFSDHGSATKAYWICG